MVCDGIVVYASVMFNRIPKHEVPLGMNVEVWLNETSRPIVYKDVGACYQKGDFYCITNKVLVEKYPIAHIFRIVETYS